MSAGTKGLRTYVQLFAVIAAANDVRCDVASNSTFVYAYGFAEDIDATHALYASLVVQMVRACDAYLAHRCAPADADHHRPAELPAGLRRPGRSTAGRSARGSRKEDAKKDKARAPGTAIALRDKEIELTRPLPHGVEGARHLAGGRAHRPGTRRRRGGPATGPGSGPGWGAVRSCPARERRCSGEPSADAQRAKVYAAEEFVRTLFDRAAEHGSRAIDFFGAQLTLPPEAGSGRWTPSRYVDGVLALPAVVTAGRCRRADGARAPRCHGRALRKPSTAQR